MAEHVGHLTTLTLAERLAVLHDYRAAGTRNILDPTSAEPDLTPLTTLTRGNGLSGCSLFVDPVAGQHFAVGIGEFSIRTMDPPGLAYMPALTLFGGRPFISKTPDGSMDHPMLMLMGAGEEAMPFVHLVADAGLLQIVQPVGSLIDMRASNIVAFPSRLGGRSAQDAAKRAAMALYDAEAARSAATLPITRLAYADLLACLAWIMNTTCGPRVRRPDGIAAVA